MEPVRVVSRRLPQKHMFIVLYCLLGAQILLTGLYLLRPGGVQLQKKLLDIRKNSPSRGGFDNDPDKSIKTQPTVVEDCAEHPSTLVGLIRIDLNVSTDLNEQKKAMPEVDWGEWKPSKCKSRHKVAIIIPYRDRLQHLKMQLRYLHPLLQRQLVHYRLFVVEQAGVGTWNKGRVMNAGFLEAAKLFDFQCVIFHDVDLVPEDDRNTYKCHPLPLHMSSAPSQDKYRTRYTFLVGGVMNFPREDFLKLNGYSNEFWGWGGEDDDMAQRLKASAKGFERVPTDMGRYTSLIHGGRDKNPRRIALLQDSKKRQAKDGVSSLPYRLLSSTNAKLYTHLLVVV
ncbi:beta-1,4-N-acetylgalactosaminyltransferase bre-4 [Lingula anatina]|uniref:Beta-1,4-galactosyltransferase n=1 Tax=Lingula anatina TaxID=7574 RepID=A0A1S3IRV3_LINAN|nr:beta-1,4-N-acetylgalactosaminyltransferase bre-4 [Lingula anatina]|eukprot:XP_013400803.1 beta-1,4-N-acetylgalactosaminyltransferase bre-4 [Lingula anatina]